MCSKCVTMWMAVPVAAKAKQKIRQRDHPGGSLWKFRSTTKPMRLPTARTSIAVAGASAIAMTAG
jgi:hypothetical protein